MTENFDFDFIKNLNRLEEAKAYLTKYFIPLDNGDIAVLKNGKYEIQDYAIVKRTYFGRLSKELNAYFFNEFTGIRNIVCELYKDTLYDKCLNICPKIKAVYKPFNEIDNDTKTKLQIFMNYIKDVLANNNNESYEYLLKWYSNAVKGNKNDACLYMKGEQGIGKSTICDFLKEYVVGTDLYLESGSKPLISNFNSILYGKLFVEFSELENFNTSQWMACSSVLKRFITSNTFLLEGKNKDAVQLNNINNYVINSNNDAIKDDEGRRYFILDINHKYKDDREYFGKIRKNCFNNEVGNAFYSYMMEYNTEEFIPQNYPITKSKLNSYAKRLDSVGQFLKDEYVLNNLGLNIKPKDLHDDYNNYCNSNNIKNPLSKIQFVEKLTNLNINYMKSGTNIYKVSYEHLKQIADKNKWIHELDEVDNNDEVEELDDVIIKQQNQQIEELKEQIENYKKEIEELKQQQLKKKKIVKKKFIVENENEDDLIINL